jgi:predicted ATPase
MSPPEGTGPIRTPDQRLRVFVSSTLRELAAERRAARAAIERLRMAPVMFELGARPHPPRQLYRAYLEQSDIFVGLYAERYGWVAPGEEVSGLEDEYNLAPSPMPRLIYIKDTGGAREPRLGQLLDRIRSDDRAAFKYFTDPAELTDLLAADLAVLLAERFDVSRRAPAHPRPGPMKVSSPTALPAQLTRMVGRAREVETIVGLLRSPGPRLLTLTGPGGIGKTRLAIEAARALAPDFPDGVLFVRLASIEDAAQVPIAIADAVGVRHSGDASIDDTIIRAVRNRRMLLLLDNFEHVLGAGPFIKDLVGGAPELRVLVTSRSLLRVLGEQSVEVSPLDLPAPRSAPWQPGASLSASVELLVDRARAVKPDFEISAENAADVEAIAARLEGVPLAIELAAARLRLLTPADLLARLDRRLAMLVGGSRSLPARQQALRTTIEWSTRLLGAGERKLLWRLGVFAGRFSLEAVECLVEDSGDALMMLEALVDSSLIRQQELNDRTYFMMLATVREYATERLEAEDDADEVRQRHAGYYRAWAQRFSADLVGARQRECVARLSSERDNLRAAELHLLAIRDWPNAAELAWSVWAYWWIGGMMGELRRWMEEVLSSGDPLPERTRAIALAVTRASLFWDRPTPEIVAALEESAGLFERLGSPSDAGVPLMWLSVAHAAGEPPDLPAAATTVDRGLGNFRAGGNRWGESVLLTTAGRLRLAGGDLTGALAKFEEALATARRSGNDFAILISLHFLGWADLLAGDLDRAVGVLAEALELSPAIEHDEGVAWDLEGFTGVAAAIGDAERAGLLAGAAESLRERIGMPDTADAIFHRPFIERLRQGPAAASFEEAFRRGRRMPAAEAVGVARELLRSVRPVAAPAS